MKAVPLKKVVTTSPSGADGELDYKEYLKTIVAMPNEGQKGLTIEEIRSSMRVLNAIEKVGGDVLDLEDQDYEYMKKKVNAARFGFASAEILQFIDDVTNVKE